MAILPVYHGVHCLPKRIASGAGHQVYHKLALAGDLVPDFVSSLGEGSCEPLRLNWPWTSLKPPLSGRYAVLVLTRSLLLPE